MSDRLALVHHVIHRHFHWAVDSGSEYDALLSAGWEGLRDAEERYDPTRGMAFSTFALPRIRGAILDYVRRERGLRRKDQPESVSLELAPPLASGEEEMLDRIDLRRGLAQLEARERESLISEYFVGETHVALAERWGRSGSRVGQVRAIALRKLRIYYGVG